MSMQFDAFISYSTQDKATADAACAALEAAGIRCWIAPRDILPGADWGAAIMDALDSCRAMVLIFSSSANTSPQIRREVERVVGRGVPVIPVRIEDIAPTNAMAYFMGPVHWLDALSPPLEQHLQRLADSLKALLAIDAGDLDRRAQKAGTPPGKSDAPSASSPGAADSTGRASPTRDGARPKEIAAKAPALALRCAVLVPTAIGCLLTIGAVLTNQLSWLPVVVALTVIAYWLVYRNLASDPATARIAAFGCAAVWAWLVVLNAAAQENCPGRHRGNLCGLPVVCGCRTVSDLESGGMTVWR
jgi:hypothetical protein